MAEVRIRPLKDGPYEVKGAVQLIDGTRAEFKLQYRAQPGSPLSHPR